MIKSTTNIHPPLYIPYTFPTRYAIHPTLFLHGGYVPRKRKPRKKKPCYFEKPRKKKPRYFEKPRKKKPRYFEKTRKKNRAKKKRVKKNRAKKGLGVYNCQTPYLFPALTLVSL